MASGRYAVLEIAPPEISLAVILLGSFTADRLTNRGVKKGVFALLHFFSAREENTLFL
jgi:hypothetical protein